MGFDACHGLPSRSRVSDAMVARSERDRAARLLAATVRLFVARPTTGRREDMERALRVWEDAEARSALPV